MKALKVVLGILLCFTVFSIMLLGYGHLDSLSHRGYIQRHFMLTYKQQNITEILANTKKALEPYIQDIKLAAKEMKCVKNLSVVGKTKKVFNAYKNGYFENVQNLPSVRTIFATLDYDMLLNMMHTTHYHYGSSDCDTLEKKGIYGKNNGLKFFNDTCHTDLASYRDHLSLNRNYLNMGLPDSYVHKHPKVTLTFMHVACNAVLTSGGDVFVDQAKLSIQRCSSSNSNRGMPRSIEKLQHYDEVFTISQFWGNGFFHFTTENLIRIGPYVDFLRENPSIKFHVNRSFGFIRNWLRNFGVNEERIVVGTIRASVLYMPAGTPCGRPTYFTANLMSMNFKQLLGLTYGPRDTIVVIKRSRKRYFKKHKEIWDMVLDVASKMGFRVTLFSDRHMPSLNETKEMFQRAVVILGPHGAGLSNMIFSQPGTVILEGLCSPVNLCYRNMAKVLGHRYVGLLFKTEKTCFYYTADHIRPYLEYFLKEIHEDSLGQTP